MLTTPFTELVGCAVPLQLAPMGGVVGPELVVAVIEAGGMGMVGAGPMPPPAVAAFADAVRARTSGPFGVNFLMPMLNPDAVAAAAQRCRVVDFYHGPVDAKLVALVHDAGALAGWQVGSTDEARAAVDAGCDLIAVRGIEGGGRMYGVLPLWPVLFEVLDAVDVPVLAAGGIGTARGVAAALAAGAAGVRMGTRFLATEESLAHPAYRDALIAATTSDTLLTEAFSVGWPDEIATHRVLRSALEAAEQLDADPAGEMTLAGMTFPVPRFGPAPPLETSTGHVEAMAMYAGQSVGAVTKVEKAGDVVRQIAADAERLLARS